MWYASHGGAGTFCTLIPFTEVQSPGNSYSCLCGKVYKENNFNQKIFKLSEETYSSLLAFTCPAVTHLICSELLFPWGLTMMCLCIYCHRVSDVFLIRCDKVRPYQLLNSPMGGPVAVHSRSGVDLEFLMERIFLNKSVRISDALSHYSLFSHQIKGWQLLQSNHRTENSYPGRPLVLPRLQLSQSVLKLYVLTKAFWKAWAPQALWKINCVILSLIQPG